MDIIGNTISLHSVFLGFGFVGIIMTIPFALSFSPTGKFRTFESKLRETREVVYNEGFSDKYVQRNLHELSDTLKSEFKLSPPSTGLRESWKIYLTGLVPLAYQGDLERARRFKIPEGTAILMSSISTYFSKPKNQCLYRFQRCLNKILNFPYR